MATSVETTPPEADCQMQPLDLSCPKVRRHSSDSSEDLSPRSSFEGSSRPRSSSGGSEAELSSTELETNRRNLVHSVLRNGWPISGFPHPHVLLGGPARKRFLTKYLHKENGETFYRFICYFRIRYHSLSDFEIAIKFTTPLATLSTFVTLLC